MEIGRSRGWETLENLVFSLQKIHVKLRSANPGDMNRGKCECDGHAPQQDQYQGPGFEA